MSTTYLSPPLLSQDVTGYALAPFLYGKILDMNKIIILAAIALIVYTSWYLFYRPQPHTMEDFITYLGTQGLAVNAVTISDEDQEFIEDFKTNYTNLQKAVGADATDDPNQPDEAGLYSIDGIEKVEIQHYSSTEKATFVYQDKLAFEQRKKDRVSTNLFNPGVYFKTEYLQAGTFIIVIRHYDVKASNGKIDPSSKYSLDLPATDLAKLRTAVAGWKE